MYTLDYVDDIRGLKFYKGYCVHGVYWPSEMSFMSMNSMKFFISENLKTGNYIYNSCGDYHVLYKIK